MNNHLGVNQQKKTKNLVNRHENSVSIFAVTIYSIHMLVVAVDV